MLHIKWLSPIYCKYLQVTAARCIMLQKYIMIYSMKLHFWVLLFPLYFSHVLHWVHIVKSQSWNTIMHAAYRNTATACYDKKQTLKKLTKCSVKISGSMCSMQQPWPGYYEQPEPDYDTLLAKYDGKYPDCIIENYFIFRNRLSPRLLRSISWWFLFVYIVPVVKVDAGLAGSEAFILNTWKFEYNFLPKYSWLWFFFFNSMY